MRSISLDRHRPRRWWLQPLGFLMLAMCLAASAKVVWDLRAAAMPGHMARSLAAQGDEHTLQAAIVTLLRESRANNEHLLDLAKHSNAAVREQATLALRHLREQLR